MKKAYRNLYDQVDPPADFQEKVFARLEPKKRKHPVLRPLGAVAAVLVVILLATPVMAAYVPEITDLMYAIAPEVAARFSPIQESCEKNGIRMEVVATSIHGATAEIYLGFTDLEGKERITNNTTPDDVRFSSRPFLFWRANGGGFSSSTDPMRYDPAHNIYYSMIEKNFSFYSSKKGRYLNVREICGDKLTVTVDNLRRWVDKEDIKLSITLREQEILTIKQDEDGLFRDERFPSFGWGGASEDPWLQKTSYGLLAPGEVIHKVSEELAVTGIAYFDGALHVQVRCQEVDVGNRPLYALYLVDDQGEWLHSIRHTAYEAKSKGKTVEYKEYHFDVAEEDLGKYSLLFDVSEEQTIEGPWRVTFPLVESGYVGERDDGIPLSTEETVFPPMSVEETGVSFYGSGYNG